MNIAPDRMTQTLLCSGMLIIWYSLSQLPGYLPHYAVLSSSGWLVPLLCSLEFLVLVALYRWYSVYYDDIPAGQVRLSHIIIFSVLLLLLLASQSLYLQEENWVTGQLSENSLTVLFFMLAVVVLAPVYEEILFRGFVLHGCLLWAPQQKVLCSLLTSLLFAAIHMQYSHLQTLIALFLLSLLLCGARFISGGLKLPIFIHMLNNLLGVLPLFCQRFLS